MPKAIGVVLKIYDPDGRLLIARPCEDSKEAEGWWNKYIDVENKRLQPRILTYKVVAIPPRI